MDSSSEFVGRAIAGLNSHASFADRTAVEKVPFVPATRSRLNMSDMIDAAARPDFSGATRAAGRSLLNNAQIVGWDKRSAGPPFFAYTISRSPAVVQARGHMAMLHVRTPIRCVTLFAPFRFVPAEGMTKGVRRDDKRCQEPFR